MVRLKTHDFAAVNLVELVSGSDRAAAIVGHAGLADQVTHSIKDRLRPDEKTFDRLFSPGGVFGAFGPQVDLAKLLGIIDDEIRRDLKLVGTIRNRFAHAHGSIGFEDVEVRKSCMKLNVIEQRLIGPEAADPTSGDATFTTTAAILEAFRFRVDDRPGTLASPRKRYTTSVLLLGSMLQQFSILYSLEPFIARPPQPDPHATS